MLIDYSGQLLINTKINKYLGQIKRVGKRIKKLHIWEAECRNCSHISSKTVFQLKKDLICRKCYNLPKGEAGFTRLFKAYKINALNSKRKFYLTKEEFRFITSQNCHYCGIKPSQISKSGADPLKATWGIYNYNGIDRKLNYLDYIFSNCLPCCGECNSMKTNKTYEEHMSYIQRLVNFHTKKQFRSKQ